mmetsp:Transcript_10396/g.15362  ORF Transcript_10396/g.15362 Transcript_10396/m.15362 type:complete len:435 (-) Transcript_10396:395-1699(-)
MQHHNLKAPNMASNKDEEAMAIMEEDTMENEPEAFEIDHLEEKYDRDSQPMKKSRVFGVFLFVLVISFAFAMTLRNGTDRVPSLSSQNLDRFPEGEAEFGEFPPAMNEPGDVDDIDTHTSLKASLAQRMKPRNLLYNSTVDEEGKLQTTFPPKQFFHLHHMKTGGTSIDSFLHCAANRLSNQIGSAIPQTRLSECGYSSYQRCISGEDENCVSRVKKAATMSYCAPLAQANAFDWDNADAITTIRDPIDRVWSMYRFTTKSCYCCLSLQEVYERHASNTLREICPGTYSGVCLPQIYDHQSRNLLTTLDTEQMDSETKLNEAIHNLKYRFSVVGVTNELPTYVEMLGRVFPWLSEDGADFEGDDDIEQKKCVIEHKNSSPLNNRCGPSNTHLPLNDEPDSKTRQVILENNLLDMKVYQEALELFDLQKEVLGMD